MTRRLPRARAPRNAEFVSLLESFLIAAIATVLTIRTQLWLTHYPQLGGRGLHIAHLLYGGIFMAIAIGILLMFLGRGPRRPAALLGGVGFGFFIDELGKFVTADNNYFFKPAAGVIYFIFIVIFLIIRRLARARPLSDEERLANAVYLAIDAAHGRLHERERARAVALLGEVDARDPLLGPVRDLLRQLHALPQPAPRFYERWGERLRAFYLRVAQWAGLRIVIMTVFIVWAILRMGVVVGTVLTAGVADVPRGVRLESYDDLSFVNVAITVCTTVSVALVVRRAHAVAPRPPRRLPGLRARAARLDPAHARVRVREVAVRRGLRAGARHRAAARRARDDPRRGGPPRQGARADRGDGNGRAGVR